MWTECVAHTPARTTMTVDESKALKNGTHVYFLVIPGQVFAHSDEETEIYFDPETDAHLGAFVVGKGSLEDW